jgi:hypothetical protein
MTIAMTIMMTTTAWSTAETVAERRGALPLTNDRVPWVLTFANQHAAI